MIQRELMHASIPGGILLAIRHRDKALLMSDSLEFLPSGRGAERLRPVLFAERCPRMKRGLIRFRVDGETECGWQQGATCEFMN